MKITVKKVKALNACEGRFNNFIYHYPKFKGTLEDFILLENISYNDKVWVFTRLATKQQIIKWSILCASKVLSIFEATYPNDLRPRQALEAVENYLNNPTEENKKAAANAADAADAADANAAYAAAYAAHAAYAADAAAYAVTAAAYAAYAAYAANAAAYAAHAAYATYVNERNIEEEVNLLFMIEALK